MTDVVYGTLMQVVVRCIWRILLPLLDLGYQVDVRIMNSVHYGVPQLRRVTLITAFRKRLPRQTGCPACSDCLIRNIRKHQCTR